MKKLMMVGALAVGLVACGSGAEDEAAKGRETKETSIAKLNLREAQTALPAQIADTAAQRDPTYEQMGWEIRGFTCIVATKRKLDCTGEWVPGERFTGPGGLPPIQLDASAAFSRDDSGNYIVEWSPETPGYRPSPDTTPYSEGY